MRLAMMLLTMFTAKVSRVGINPNIDQDSRMTGTDLIVIKTKVGVLNSRSNRRVFKSDVSRSKAEKSRPAHSKLPCRALCLNSLREPGNPRCCRPDIIFSSRILLKTDICQENNSEEAGRKKLGTREIQETRRLYLPRIDLERWKSRFILGLLGINA